MRTFNDNQLGKKDKNVKETVGPDLQALTENDGVSEYISLVISSPLPAMLIFYSHFSSYKNTLCHSLS